MHLEKTTLGNEIKARLEGSPYVILMDFTGLAVQDFSELRGRLAKASAHAMVVKNSLLRRTLKDLSLPEMNGALKGPTAVVYGSRDMTAAAAVLKNFSKEFKKPRIKGGILDRAILSEDDLKIIADLPSREMLMSQLLGVLSSPASMFARLLNTPASQLVRVLKAKSENQK